MLNQAFRLLDHHFRNLNVRDAGSSKVEATTSPFTSRCTRLLLPDVRRSAEPSAHNPGVVSNALSNVLQQHGFTGFRRATIRPR